MIEGYKHENLISIKAASRYTEHFWKGVKLPENVEKHPKPISLAGGVPHYGIFPINSITVGLNEKPYADGYDEDRHDDEGIDFDKFDSFRVPQVKDGSKDEIDIQNGLQYSWTRGIDTLCDVVYDITKRVVNPVMDDWNITLTAGSGSGIIAAFDSFLDQGDTVLVEEFTFTPVLTGVRNIGAIPIPVPLNFHNNEGIDIPKLKELLENWSAKYPHYKKPKMLYTISNGQNPIGAAQSLESKKLIYELAEEHDFMILEDDPYGYLQFPPYEDYHNGKLKVDEPITNDDFIKLLYPTYLQLDKTGRVIRAETFSKVFAPGLRLGFLIAHKRPLETIEEYHNVTTRGVSGASQILVSNTIKHLGGVEGWLQWITKVRNEYVKRRNAMLEGLMSSKAYKDGYLTILDPKAGMFVACIINFSKKGCEPKDTVALMDRLIIKGMVTGVIFVNGANMTFKDEVKERGNFARLSIAAGSSLRVLTEGGARFGQAVSDLFEEL